MTENNENPMREIKVEKVTLNMGVGQTGEELKKASTILQTISGGKPVETASRARIPTWNLRIGLTIGTKVTLRKKKAEEFLQRAFAAVDKQLKAGSFDKFGNFGFGVKEYIDLPQVKYDPKLGIKGFDVLVTLERKGYRIKKRKIAKKRISKRHSITKEEALVFVKNKYGVVIV